MPKCFERYKLVHVEATLIADKGVRVPTTLIAGESACTSVLCMLEMYRSLKNDFTLLDRKAVFALVYAAIGLSCIYYLKNPEFLADILSNTRFEHFGNYVAHSESNNLPPLGYWVVVVTIFYFVIPAAVIKLSYRENLGDYGLRLSIEKGFWKLFALCSVVILPLVYWMSLTSSFAAKYPFFQVYNGDPYLSSAFFVWESIYFAQFFGLEFFFRGFLVHSLKPAFGIYSIFIMTVPYCMIHFGKPPAETFAAIFAGVFLGWLSLKNGSIWLGLALHCTVAFTMDVFALYNKGLL
ncbi:MAG: CPBP family intramembrane metalloprotease [Saprospiraceae bacterium]|nr:CPBP family intramembrane metalloprotease [Pyrinomonadaceae bacterium]